MPEAVTVVIPCYQQAHFLARALASCRAQRCAPAVIVVDDGSPDDVAAAAAPFAGVSVVRQANAGLAAARNAGLARVATPLVAFLDADDWYLDGGLDLLVTLAGAGTPAMGGWRVVHDDGHPGADVRPSAAPMAEALMAGNVGPPHLFVHATAALRAIGGFRDIPGGHEDYDLLARLALAGAAWVVDPRPVVAYRQHPASMSRHAERMRRSRTQTWVAYITALPIAELAPGAAAALAEGVLETLRRTGSDADACAAAATVLPRLPVAPLLPAVRIAAAAAAIRRLIAPVAGIPAADLRRAADGLLDRALAAMPGRDQDVAVRPALAGMLADLLAADRRLALRALDALDMDRCPGDFARVIRTARLLARLPLPAGLGGVLLPCLRDAGQHLRSRRSGR